MAPSFEVLPARDGRWLVRDGQRRFIVPHDLGKRLDGCGGERLWRDLVARHVAENVPHRLARGLWLRIPVLPGVLVRRLAGHLAGLASAAWLSGLAAFGILALVLVPRPAADDAMSWLPVLAVFLTTALMHEVGHAAALAREGWPPGAVGVGLLWVLPVCWCDVSAVTLLGRGGRVRVDLAGVAFQLAAAGLAVIAASVAHEPAVALGARLALGAVIWSLLPIARTDGYWLACDVLDLPDLEAPVTVGCGRGRCFAAAAWRSLTAVSLVALLALLAWRLQGAMHTGLDGDTWPAVLARGLGGCVLLVGILSAARRIGRLVAAVGRDLRS